MDTINNNHQISTNEVSPKHPLNSSPIFNTSAAHGFNVLFDFTNKIYGDLDEIKSLMDNGQRDLAMKLLSELVHNPVTIGGQTFQGEGMAELNFLQCDLLPAISDHADQWKQDQFVQDNPQLQAAIPQKLNDAILNYIGQMSTLFKQLDAAYVAGDDDMTNYYVTYELANGHNREFRRYLLSLLSPAYQKIMDDENPIPLILPTTTDPVEKDADTLSATLFSLESDTAFLANMDLVNKNIPSHLQDTDEADELLKDEETTDNRYFGLGSDMSTQPCGVQACVTDIQNRAAAPNQDPYFSNHKMLLDDLGLQFAGSLHNDIPSVNWYASGLVPDTLNPMPTVADLRQYSEAAYQTLDGEMRHEN